MTFEEIIVIKLILFFLLAVAMVIFVGILPRHKDDKSRARSNTKSLLYKRPCSPTPRV